MKFTPEKCPECGEPPTYLLESALVHYMVGKEAGQGGEYSYTGDNITHDESAEPVTPTVPAGTMMNIADWTRDCNSKGRENLAVVGHCIYYEAKSSTGPGLHEWAVEVSGN